MIDKYEIKQYLSPLLHNYIWAGVLQKKKEPTITVCIFNNNISRDLYLKLYNTISNHFQDYDIEIYILADESCTQVIDVCQLKKYKVIIRILTVEDYSMLELADSSEMQDIEVDTDINTECREQEQIHLLSMFEEAFMEVQK